MQNVRAIVALVNLGERACRRGLLRFRDAVSAQLDRIAATKRVDHLAEQRRFRHRHSWSWPVRQLGVRFAIDDFGSRSATLGDPADIPVDILKIDRNYISQLTRRAEDHAATRAIIALGRLKQLRTVAAGIEEEDQMTELLRFRCEYGQGTLFSEPLDAEGVMRLLRRD